MSVGSFGCFASGQLVDVLSTFFVAPYTNRYTEKMKTFSLISLEISGVRSQLFLILEYSKLWPRLILTEYEGVTILAL